jgi:hypothetical protein
MEAVKTKLAGKDVKLDLVDARVQAADENVTDGDVAQIERSTCPTCGSCSAGPAGIPTQRTVSQSTRWPSLDLDVKWVVSVILNMLIARTVD